MKTGQWFFDFYLNSSIHVALGVVSLLGVSAYYLDISLDANVCLFTFFATITGYNFIKYAGVAKWHHRSLTRTLRAIQLFSLLCFIGMCYYGWQLSAVSLQLLVVLGLLTVLYALPLFSRKRSLRTLRGLKIYTIALVWAGVTVLLPVVEANLTHTPDVWIVFAQRVLYVIAITLPFEIRDLKYDQAELGTLPQLIGVPKTKYLGSVIVSLFFILEWFRSGINSSILILGLLALVMLWGILKSSSNQSRYFAAFWVEGISILWIIVIGLFELTVL